MTIQKMKEQAKVKEAMMAELTEKQNGLREALKEMEETYKKEKEEYFQKAASEESSSI